MEFLISFLGFIFVLFLCLKIIKKIFIFFTDKSKSEIVTENTFTTSSPYYLKQNFFSTSEKIFFEMLMANLQNTNFVIFSKTRLADLVEIKVQGKERLTPWNKIKSKQIDFSVFDLSKNKVVLLVELDGNSHRSQKALKSDNFKNELFSNINIPLHRVRVGSNFSTEIEKIKELLLLKEKSKTESISEK